MVGDGHLLNKCKNLVAQLGLNERIIFTSKLSQSELPSLYRRANLFLLPSEYEIYGMVIIESMYFGTPVISSMTAGACEIIEDGIDGRIVKELDLNKWAIAISELLIQQEKYQELSLNAEKKIKENFLWEKVAECYAKIYRQVILR